MVKSIIAYGHSILRTTCLPVENDTEEVKESINTLWDTLEVSGGIGLAAPQINSPQSVFIVKSTLMYDDLSESQRTTYFSGDKGIEETFINASILAESEEVWSDFEACLSIPEINESIERAWQIIIEYQDKDLNFHRKQFSGYTAKVIQHEYDHTQGILFIDYLPDLTRRLLKGKLKKIEDGNIETKYSIKYLKP